MKKQNLFKLLYLLPIIWGLYLILYYGVNIVIGDEWSTVYLIDDINKNGFTLEKLFSLHNEHRLFFPRLIMLALVNLFHFNVKVEMLVNIIFLSAIYYIIVKFINKSTYIMKYKDIYILIIGFLLFNGIQWENLFLGFQITLYLIIFSTVLSSYYFQKLIENNNVKYLIPIIVLSIISSFSSLNGLFIWIVFLMIFIVLRLLKYKIPTKYFYIVFIFGLLSFIIYFLNYSEPYAHPSYFGKGLLWTAKYFFIALGTVCNFNNLNINILLGIAIFGITTYQFFVITKNKNILKNIFPISLILYSYAVIGSIAIGRSDLGLEQSMSSRYTTYELIILIGIVIIFITNMDFHKHKLKPLLFLSIIISIWSIYQNYALIDTYTIVKSGRNELKNILVNYKSKSIDELNRVYPFGNYENACNSIQILEHNEYNIFYQ